jgi:hypothetical protein
VGNAVVLAREVDLDARMIEKDPCSHCMSMTVSIWLRYSFDDDDVQVQVFFAMFSIASLGKKVVNEGCTW